MGGFVHIPSSNAKKHRSSGGSSLGSWEPDLLGDRAPDIHLSPPGSPWHHAQATNLAGRCADIQQQWHPSRVQQLFQELHVLLGIYLKGPDEPPGVMLNKVQHGAHDVIFQDVAY